MDAENLAREAGNLKAFNTVMLGAAANYIGIRHEALEKAIESYFSAKGEAVIQLNIKAFRLGTATI